MRENRTSGSEGGDPGYSTRVSYPYRWRGHIGKKSPMHAGQAPRFFADLAGKKGRPRRNSLS